MRMMEVGRLWTPGRATLGGQQVPALTIEYLWVGLCIATDRLIFGKPALAWFYIIKIAWNLSRRIHLLIPQGIANLVARRSNVIDRPHPFLIKPGLRDQGLAVGSEQSIFDDEIRQIVAIE